LNDPRYAKIQTICNDFKNCKFTFNLVRGFNFYTGLICEIFTKYKPMDSICSGGEYTYKEYKLKGLSIGVSRLSKILPEYFNFQKKILIIKLLDSERINNILKLLYSYPITIKYYPYITQSFKFYLNKLIKSSNFKYLVFLGEKEIKSNILQIKNLQNNKTKVYNLKEFQVIYSDIFT
jgi:histidyl-tRNA synthetase